MTETVELATRLDRFAVGVPLVPAAGRSPTKGHIVGKKIYPMPIGDPAFPFTIGQPMSDPRNQEALKRRGLCIDEVILVDIDSGMFEAVEVPPELSKAWAGDPDKPRDLAELADLVRRDFPKKHRVIAFLVYMHVHSSATFAELRCHVHEGYDADEETVKGNIKEARRFVKRYTVPVRLSVSRGIVSRKYMSQ